MTQTVSQLTKLWPSDSRSNWNLEMLVFEKGGKTGGHGEKTLRARTRTNNKLNLHMTQGPRIKPGAQWWEVSALTIQPSPTPPNSIIYSVPVKFFTQVVMKTIQGVTMSALSLSHAERKPEFLKKKTKKSVQNDTQVSTFPLFETSLLWYERIVDTQRNVQKTRLTKFYYQQTDGTEKQKG